MSVKTKLTKTKLAMMIVVTALFFGGCTKDAEEYNKPAAYWYAKVIASISSNNLEKADDYYSSLQGEHVGSPLLPEATMILAIAHMHYEEYVLGEYFLNEYVTRYANPNEREFAEYLKIKAKYLALPNPRRDQVLINEAITEGEKFKSNYPNSMYYGIVDTMLTNLYMAAASLNESISDLYTRLDKPKSAKYYKTIQNQSWIRWENIDRDNTPWYREWFEGDGTSSWYGFLIPHTRSVVSRNSVSETETNSTSGEKL
ncbi:MAG: outer membrane protein assembly factor BamD [Sulfurimonas sp.]|jgi:outer membrane protein assembly factor BamD